MPEIYYTVNYDITTKHVCVSLGLCEENVVSGISTESNKTEVSVSSVPVTNSVNRVTGESNENGEILSTISRRPIPVEIVSQIPEPYDKIGPKQGKMVIIRTRYTFFFL